MENGSFSTVSGLKRQAWGQTKGLPMGLTKKCKQQDVKQFLVIGDQVEYLGIMTVILEGCPTCETVPKSQQVSTLEVLW